MQLEFDLVVKIKDNIRIQHHKLNEDIEDTIKAALLDLGICGVKTPKDYVDRDLDPLLLNAVKLYCKAEYTDDTGKAAEYLRRYESLKSCLMMAGEYKEMSANE